MRLFILFLIFCLSYSAYSQEWEEVEVSEDVTVAVPKGYKVYDDLISKKLIADIDRTIFFSTDVRIIKRDSFAIATYWPISDTFKIKKFFTDETEFYNSLSDSPDSVYTGNFIKLSGLIAYTSKISPSKTDKPISSYLSFLLNNQWYTFFYANANLSMPFNKKVELMERFFTSIKIREGLTIEDQFTK